MLFSYNSQEIISDFSSIESFSMPGSLFSYLGLKVGIKEIVSTNFYIYSHAVIIILLP